MTEVLEEIDGIIGCTIEPAFARYFLLVADSEKPTHTTDASGNVLYRAEVRHPSDDVAKSAGNVQVTYYKES